MQKVSVYLLIGLIHDILMEAVKLLQRFLLHLICIHLYYIYYKYYNILKIFGSYNVKQDSPLLLYFLVKIIGIRPDKEYSTVTDLRLNLV